MSQNLPNMLSDTISKIREMMSVNDVVGEPSGVGDVTIIPISKVSFGFGSGGGDYGKPAKDGFGGGAAAGVKIEPVSFLIIKDGITRVVPVAVPPATTVDRIVEMVPDIMDKVEKYFDKKGEKEII